MKKTAVCSVVIMLCGITVSAQQLNPSVLSVDGGTAKTSTIILSWTLGEAVTESVTAGGFRYTQGFHQPLLQIVPLPVLAAAHSDYKISVAPNPVYSYLNVQVYHPAAELITIDVTDVNGKLLSTTPAPAKGTTRLGFSSYTAGVYIINLRTRNGELLQSYKILKAQ